MATNGELSQLSTQASDRERLCLAVAGLNAGIWDWDIVSDEVYWSPALFQQLGYAPDEIVPSYSVLKKHVHPEDLDVFERSVQGHLEQGEKDTVSCRLRGTEGRYQWFHLGGQAQWNETGSPIRFVGSLQEITNGKGEEIFRSLVETTQDWVWEMNLDGQHTYSNHRIEDILGYSLEEFYQLNIFDLFHPEDRIELDKHFPDLVSVQEGWSKWDIRIRAKDGSYRYLESNAVPVLDSNGELVGFRGIDRDVTERRLEKRELRERLQFEILVSELSASFINVPHHQVDEELKLALAKLAKFFDLDRCKLCRCLPEENAFVVCRDYVKETVIELPFQVDTETFVWSTEQVEKGNVVSISDIEELPAEAKSEREYMRAAGIKAFMSIPAELNHLVMGGLHVADGRSTRQWTESEKKRLRFFAEFLLSFILRKQQELELDRARSTLLASVESSPAGIVIADAPDGSIRMVNRAALASLGESLESVSGMPMEQYSSTWQFFRANGDAYESEELPLSRAILHGETLQNVEIILELSTGERRWLLANAAPVRDATDEIVAGVAIFIDITEIKQAAVEREELIQELEVKHAELERFTYTVSHDLKSPVITIKGFLGLLRNELKSGDLTKVESRIQRICAACDQMSLLLNELLELSRIGRIEKVRELVSVSDIARLAENLVGSLIEGRQVKVEIDPNMPSIFVDKIRMVEVFQNLIDNAVRFADQATVPLVQVGMQQIDGRDVYFVADNGAGIAPAYQEKVFGLFEQLEPKLGGTGVGLAIVKRIIEVHGGNVWIESDGEGTGTKVCFTVPPSQQSE